MKIGLSGAGFAREKSDCLIVGVRGGASGAAAKKVAHGGMAGGVDKALGGLIARVIGDGDFKAGVGEAMFLRPLLKFSHRRVLLVGLGSAKQTAPRDFLRAADCAFAAAAQSGAKSAFCLLAAEEVDGKDSRWTPARAALSARAAGYKFHLGKAPAAHPLARVDFYLPAITAAHRAAVKRAEAVADGCSLARHLAEQPPNVCDPQYLAASARGLKNLRVKTLDAAKMRALKMGAFLAVAQGSAKPPRLIVMEHRGGGAARPIALVGKGVTFDTGGISLKPSAAMDEMKYDMCGAAAVIGALHAAAQMRLPLNIVGIVAACENMPDANASRPGDIVRTMAGKTVEILNTDAEGRLILADALAYAEKFNPQLVIDAATLTGACVVALGHFASGLFCKDEALAAELAACGEDAGDFAWPLPLWDEYDKMLKSDFADVANISGGRAASAITAACFLGRFAPKKSPWAHLDIAGAAWTTKKRATGRPVPLLCNFLMKRAGWR